MRLGPPKTRKNGPLRRIRWDERPETVGNVRLVSCAQDTIVCAPHRSIRCYRGTPTTKSGRSVGVRTPGPPSGSTCEGEPFPKRKRFGISEPSPRRSLPPVNSFARRILETSRLDFLNHSRASTCHSRANAGRRIVNNPFARLCRVAFQKSLTG